MCFLGNRWKNTLNTLVRKDSLCKLSQAQIENQAKKCFLTFVQLTTSLTPCNCIIAVPFQGNFKEIFTSVFQLKYLRLEITVISFSL